MKKLLSLLAAGVLSLGLVACSSTTTTEKTDSTETSAQTETKKEEDVAEYKVGDTVTIKKDGKEIYSYSIDKITVVDERNEFEETNPEQVILVDYTYKNIDYPDMPLFMDDTFAFKFMAKEGEMGYPYGAPSLSKYPTEAPTGGVVHAQMAIGFEKTTSEVKILQYDNLFDSKETSIVVSPVK